MAMMGGVDLAGDAGGLTGLLMAQQLFGRAGKGPFAPPPSELVKFSNDFAAIMLKFVETKAFTPKEALETTFDLVDSFRALKAVRGTGLFGIDPDDALKAMAKGQSPKDFLKERMMADGSFPSSSSAFDMSSILGAMGKRQ
jgi:hypothetical protein